MSDIEAFVLAGGASRRFGSDKARAVVDGVTLIERNVAVLRRRYDRVRVISAPGRNYDDLGLITLWDLVENLGPLAGIHAALSFADTDLVAIAPCDVLGLDADWYAALEQACGRGAAAFRDDRWHPLIGVYHKALLPELEDRLRLQQLAVRDLLDARGTAVPVPAGFEALQGVNTPEEAEGAGAEPRPATRGQSPAPHLDQRPVERGAPPPRRCGRTTSRATTRPPYPTKSPSKSRSRFGCPSNTRACAPRATWRSRCAPRATTPSSRWASCSVRAS